MKKLLYALLAALLPVLPAAGNHRFDLVTPGSKVSICYTGTTKLDSIAAHLLAADIERVTGYRPAVLNNAKQAKGNVILTGHAGTAPFLQSLKGQWERYSLRVINNGAYKTLVITGSDARGAAYGVFDISARIGVNPWYWWADVTPKQQKTLSLEITDFVSKPPSVKYRGIFLNDEDWGLQPWAAKTFEPETGDIGPKTYAKIFELLLRLKANLIWPAMHPSTKPFFHYPGNRQMAEDYGIVIGTSHAEPMLRNNVGEWNEKTMGAFNYISNKEQVEKYWESRVQESRQLNAIYSIGMRGVHDSGMEGAKTPAESAKLLKKIFESQRNMLRKYMQEKVPQAFTLYKEVLDVYDAGLQVPEDVTLVWPDDNYGYIQRLSGAAESKRSGGSGVYYHASYWGRPHDYLWLPSTSPGLMRAEMTKAWLLNSRTIWVVNVGDIKPSEYQTQFFLDAAYDIQPFLKGDYAAKHLQQWLNGLFGPEQAAKATEILSNYYALAFERRPEFMGWSQTEPTTRTQPTAYNHFSYGDQAQRRLDAYADIADAAKRLQTEITPDRQDCFYQLLYYPVVCADYINQKFLYQDKARLYAQQGRLIATHYDSMARAAYQHITKETDYYNRGKWRYMMSMAPRNLPVFSAPDSVHTPVPQTAAWRVSNNAGFLDVYLTRDTVVNYTITTSAKTSISKGQLRPGATAQQRVWIHASKPNDSIVISDGNTRYVEALQAAAYISIHAKNYQEISNTKSNSWNKISGLSGTGASLQSWATDLYAAPDTTEHALRQRAMIAYYFTTTTSGPATINIHTLPTYPLHKGLGMRYAISIDNGALTMLNFQTFGRSEEWKQAVLSNTITRSVKVPQVSPGKHVLRIYMVDPGVILDRITIDLGGLQPFYGIIPSTL